jgi:2-dehydro-3-deoxyphosphogluconate aldolase / (4S)-4-hydroxy-2-oxoglutarate aldolase
MKTPFEILAEYGFFPIVEIRDSDTIRPLMRTLIDAGLPIIEITMRTDAALDALRIVRDEFPQVLLGAGTILTCETAKKAHEAGAAFMLSPGFNPKVVDYCVENGYSIAPGISSATQIEWALERGIGTVKFFPAEASGGVASLKAMANPFKMMKFIPTGGIRNQNIASYLSFDPVISCGGTWIAKDNLIRESQFEEIARHVNEAFVASHGFAIEGIELTGGARESDATHVLSSLFGAENALRLVEHGASVSASSDAGVTIVISTINLKRAEALFVRKGLHPDRVLRGEKNEGFYLGGNGCRFKVIRKPQISNPPNAKLERSEPQF